MTLTEFLLARIAEDEQGARRCEKQSWQYDDGVATARQDSELRFGGRYAVVEHRHVWGPRLPISTADSGQSIPDMQHIARWDPARVLAECEAKRRIVERCRNGCECHTSGNEGGHGVDWDADVLQLLALPYADHPDYDEGWRP